MEALGRLLNIVPTAAGAWVSLRDATGVTFVCVGADTYSLDEATDGAGSGNQDLAVIDRYQENDNADGSTGWTLESQTAGHELVTGDAAAAFHVDAAQLSAGYTHVQVSVAATGLVYAITHDLAVQRSPELLPALTG